ncbi:hypothetical protein PQX77_017571 [Marasmius sp. AFHP31]|nr:hypothetical protein PQX77_017571 [Marasmius sp. AFHP31]
MLTNIFVNHFKQVSNDLDPSIRQKLMEDPLSARELVTDPVQLAKIVDGYRRGFYVIFLVMASLAAVAFVFTLIFMTHSTLKRDDDEKLRQEAKERLAAEKAGGGRENSG